MTLQCGWIRPIFFSLSEATIRFLKAKLRVMQEEMDRLCQECTEKVGTAELLF